MDVEGFVRQEMGVQSEQQKSVRRKRVIGEGVREGTGPSGDQYSG